MGSQRRRPFTIGPRGALTALLAALAFGLTAPLLKRYGASTGPFTTAALLYGGAATASLGTASASEAKPQWLHLPRIAGVAVLGAVIAPVCLAWGLQRTHASTAALLLNFEVVLTVLAARVFYAEPLGRRVGGAVALMATGGALLAVRTGAPGSSTALPAIAVFGASLAWSLDNVLMRPLAELDPSRVVLWKGVIGALLSSVLARALGEGLPAASAAFGIAVCGAIGYGLSLRLYLKAQRQMGAARTGSLFSLAPFIGAITAVAMGEGEGGVTEIVAGALFALAVALHLGEKHAHAHTHAPLDHEHAHRHDDGHHDHVHDVYPAGEHSHPHHHDARSHAHPHAPDAHHRHDH